MDLYKRFWKNVNKDGPYLVDSKCWLWTGAIFKSTGYGQITVNYRPTTVHRVAWELRKGTVPKGIYVSQFCKNRLCVRHIFLRKPGLFVTSLEDRFWVKVQKTNLCWVWVGALSNTGYGSISGIDGRRGKRRNAHRVSWEIHFGEIPTGMSVLHSCDNRSCVRPDHLFLGTAKDNVIDMINKGRDCLSNPLPGERNGASKLTSEEVLAIRDKRKQGLTLRELGQCYGVSTSCIGLIVNRKKWRHI